MPDALELLVLFDRGSLSPALGGLSPAAEPVLQIAAEDAAGLADFEEILRTDQSLRCEKTFVPMKKL